MKGVRAYCTNEHGTCAATLLPGKKKGDEEMLCIGNNQPTEEFPVEANEAFQDAEDREESAERVNWNQAQQNGTFGNCVAQPEKKNTEIIFII